MIYSLVKIKVFSARDKHYSDWMYIWNELSLPMGKRAGYDLMVGADPTLFAAAGGRVYVPLEFWWCRNVGLALPLIALNIAGQKSTPLRTFERCSEEYRFESQYMASVTPLISLRC